MELTQNEKKVVSQNEKSFSFLFVVGALLIILPELFVFYIKAAPFERMEKVFPQLVEMRSIVERDAKKFDQYKTKTTNQRELDLVDAGLQLKWGILQQAYLTFSMFTVLFVRFVQAQGFVLVLFAFHNRRLSRVVKKLIVNKEGEK